jgi:hypothetical protein
MLDRMYADKPDGLSGSRLVLFIRNHPSSSQAKGGIDLDRLQLAHQLRYRSGGSNRCGKHRL